MTPAFPEFPPPDTCDLSLWGLFSKVLPFEKVAFYGPCAFFLHVLGLLALLVFQDQFCHVLTMYQCLTELILKNREVYSLRRKTQHFLLHKEKRRLCGGKLQVHSQDKCLDVKEMFAKLLSRGVWILNFFLSKHTIICRTAVTESSPSLLRDFFLLAENSWKKGSRNFFYFSFISQLTALT